jgi:hypothetical protein
MMRSLLREVICQTFETERHTGALYGPARPNKAMIIGFRCSRLSGPGMPEEKEGEEDQYYWGKDLLIYAPTNYVQVWWRDRWNPAFEGFQAGTTEWEKLSDHDSGWREDGVARFLERYEDKLLVFSGPQLGRWYSIVGVPEELRTSYGSTRR